MKYIGFSLCLGLIAGCGPLYENRGGGVLSALSELAGLGGDEPAAAPAISPEVANAQPGDLLLVNITGRGAVAALTRAQVNGNTTTWISPGQVTMTFTDGILVGTRGLNDDLMGVDAPQTRAAIAAGGGTVTRAHSFLNSTDQIVTSRMTCTVTRIGPEEITTVEGARTAVKFEEACSGPTLVLTNKYWLDGGQIIRSSQAVSAGVGFIQVDQL